MTREEGSIVLESLSYDLWAELSDRQRDALDIAIEALKEQRPHGEWIPCSERLPEDDKEVLVYVRRKDVEKSEMNGLHIAIRHQMEGDPEGNNNFWGIPVAPCKWRIEGWSYFFEPEVLAWQPLPDPYRKEGDSDA